MKTFYIFSFKIIQKSKLKAKNQLSKQQEQQKHIITYHLIKIQNKKSIKQFIFIFVKSTTQTMIKHEYLLLIMIIASTKSISNDTCSTIINQSVPNKYCNAVDKTCSFYDGLDALADSSDVKYFSICINLPGYQIQIGSNAIIDNQLPNSVQITSQSITFQQNYTLILDKQIVITATQQISTSNLTFISANLVWFQAPNIIIEKSKIENNSSIQTQCNCYDQLNTNCLQQWNLTFPLLWTDVSATEQQYDGSIFGKKYNYTSIDQNAIILYGQQQIVIENSTLMSSMIGIFAQNVTINDTSTISTTGNGYPSATGYGCGYFDSILNQLLGCTGSGGSYGGFGGNSWPDNCNLMISKSPYQLNNYPSSPGSGGGFFIPGIKQASSGGGVINIQAINISIWNSVVESNGKGGTQGGGGGSGGSVALDYFLIGGNSNISADGGQGKSSGGGGRIWLWNHNWRYQQYNPYLSQFKITAKGGQGCYQLLSCGQNGSITTSPCQPGFQLNLNNFICQQCTVGYYQSQYGYTQCQQCMNKPANSYYKPLNNTSNLFSSACHYQCSNYLLLSFLLDASYIEVDGKCLSNFINIINTIGGINMLISVGIIVCAIIGYLIIVLFEKLTEKQLFNQKKQQDPHERRMHFRVEDIPFHEKRIYFTGENSPNKPWQITQQTKQSYKKYAMPPITKLDNILTKLLKEINLIAKYPKKYTILMTILKFFYYPLYRYIQQLFRVDNAEAITKLVILTNKKIPQTQNLTIKVHVSPYCTMGCLEIFNYNKSALDFYIQDYFPIYFRLQKMPLGGYAIDLNDPFMKAFISQIDQKQSKSLQRQQQLHDYNNLSSSIIHKQFTLSSSTSLPSKVYEKYIKQLDQLLRNTQQLIPILNHLWMMTEYNPSIQVYLYQQGNNILGVQAYHSINHKLPLYLVFSSQNSNKHQFISQQPLNNIYLHSVEYFNNQYKFRQQVTHEDKKSVFWEIENNFNQKVLSWSLGILTIFILLQVVIQFFILIFVQAQKQVQFTYGLIIYLVLFPFTEFFAVYLCFRLILSKNCKILADSLYFSLGNILKFIILITLGLFANIDTEFGNILMNIIFYLWIVSLLCNIVSLFLKLLLHYHYSRHKYQHLQQNGHKKKVKLQ